MAAVEICEIGPDLQPHQHNFNISSYSFLQTPAFKLSKMTTLLIFLPSSSRVVGPCVLRQGTVHQRVGLKKKKKKGSQWFLIPCTVWRKSLRVCSTASLPGGSGGANACTPLGALRPQGLTRAAPQVTLGILALRLLLIVPGDTQRESERRHKCEGIPVAWTLEPYPNNTSPPPPPKKIKNPPFSISSPLR